jgi:hypothetical protein
MPEKKIKHNALPPKIVILRPAEEVLKEAIEKGNWFEGVVLSTVYLERDTIDRLKHYFMKKGILHPHPILEGLRLWKASRILEKLKIIDHKTSSLIGEINRYRNHIVHKARAPDVIDSNEAKDKLEKSIMCLGAIADSY